MALIPFEPFSTYAVIGPTQVGKSTWMYKFFQHMNDLFVEDVPDEVLYCYGVHQPLYDEMKSTCSFIQFQEGLPTKEELDKFASGSHKIVVLDDLLSEVVQNPEMERLFTQGSHHKRLSVFFLQQNIYQQGRCSKTISLNTAYLVLFQSRRDKSQLNILGRQLKPGYHHEFIQAYDDAVSKPYGYLIVDLKPYTEDRFRWRTNIWPGENPIIYEV